MKKNLHIAAAASVLPARDLVGAILTNDRLTELMEGLSRECEQPFAIASPDFPEERVGILERHVLDRDLSVRDMAVAAARRALDRSRVESADVACVLVSSVTPDRSFPAIATSVHAELGCPPQACAFDVSIGCNGFLVALDVAARQLEQRPVGAAAVIVASETMTRVADAKDRTTVPLFGDAAGAIVLVKGTEARLHRIRIDTLGAHGARIAMNPPLADGRGVHRITCSEGVLMTTCEDLCPQSIELDGKRVFRDMVRTLPQFVRSYLNEQGVQLDEVDRFLFHQANARMLDAVAGPGGLALDPERLLKNIATVGNTASASIPVLLAEAAETGQLRRGDLALLCAFGSGYSIGALLLEW